MKLAYPLLVVFAIPMGVLVAGPAATTQDDAALVKTAGTLLFEDSFDREEASPDKEEIGAGWTTNSAGRAKGAKQADLADGALHVTRSPEANHAPCVFHDIAFQDGAVQFRFKLTGSESVALDFVDRELKTVHAGHLCNAKVSLKELRLVDTKTGGANLEIKEKIEKKQKDPALAKLLKSKTNIVPIDLKAGEWHAMLVVVEGDTMRVTIDGKPAGQLKSEGIAHPTKRMLTWTHETSGWIDDVKVWKLK